MPKGKKIGLISATFIGISSIIGSGWLFAAYKTTAIAGPAGLLAWILAAFVIILLALCFSEIASLYPRRGLSAVVATMSHNKYFGFPFAIANWLGIVAVIALEADATVQYLINLFPQFKDIFFENSQLTLAGDSLSLILVIMYAVINFWGINLLAKTNNILSVIKTVIPLLTAILILTVAFHPHNFTAVNHSFAPYGYGSIMTAIVSTGIIISFNGFQSIMSFSNEVKKPHINIPLSVIISIVFCLFVYLTLQVAYIAGMPKDYVAQGWNKITFNAPMVQLASAIGLGYLSTIIYFGAFIAPTGTAITFVGSSTRMFTAMAKSEQMPSYFSKVNEKIGMSRRSLFANIFIAAMFLLCFKSWATLSLILSIFHVISYLPIPIALFIFRRKIKAKAYKFRLIGGKSIAVFIFVIFNMLVMAAQAKIFFEVFVIFVVFQLIFIGTAFRGGQSVKVALKESFPIFIYFACLAVLTYFSPANSNILSGALFYIVAIAFSLLSFWYLVNIESNDKGLVEDTLKAYLNAGGH